MKTNTALVGPMGSGKTKSLETLLRCGISPRVITLEPGINHVLGHIPCSEGLHWHFIGEGNASWEDVMPWIQRMSTISEKMMDDSSDPNRTKYTGFYEVFAASTDFVCDRCGEALGCVDNWSDDTALAIDGMSGLTKLARQALLGAKPFMTNRQVWMIQNSIEAYVRLAYSRKCSFILLCHEDREIIHSTGQVVRTIHTVGQKLAPIITDMMDEVIATKRVTEGNRTVWYWSTDEDGVATKTRTLPWSNKLKPDFGQIFQ